MNWLASDFPFYSQTQPRHTYNPHASSSHDYFLQEQKLADQKFIEHFERNLSDKKRVAQQKPIKLYEGKLWLSQIIREKESIKNQITCLNGTEDTFTNQVTVLKNRILELNDRILEFQNNISRFGIKKKMKKRERLKRKKSEVNEIKRQKQESIKEKNEVIEKFLSDKAEEIERVKREAALKRQADSVLHEVRRKKFEAKKMLNLLSALKKLRELRSKEEEERGGYCSKPLTETFNQVIERFQHMWEKQSGMYDLEEKGLKMMLEESSPTVSRESPSMTNILEWEKVLFGELGLISENERMLTRADHDANVLIQVRKDWDQFLAGEPTPMASSIPPGWVIPLDKSNNKWKAHIT